MKKLITILIMAIAVVMLSCSNEETDPTKITTETTLAEKAGTYNGIIFADEPSLKGNAKGVISDDGKSITFIDPDGYSNIFDTSADADKKGMSYGPYKITEATVTIAISFIFIDETSATVNISVSDSRDPTVTMDSSSVFTKS